MIVQRFVDTFIAFPGIILALALMAALGSSVTNIIIAVGHRVGAQRHTHSTISSISH